jgi:hypothetical protein
LSDLEIPFVSDRLAAYERTLARLAALDVRVLAPGHGAATTDQAEACRRLEHDQAYLRALRSHVGRAVAGGLSLEETLAACAGLQYRRPDENEAYHRLNVESAYVELGGRADPAKVGWARE